LSIRLDPVDFDRVQAVLVRAQDLGFLGPGPIDDHIYRSLDLGCAIAGDVQRILDLGSGGGLPGLPLAVALPETQWVLLEGSTKRAAFLTEALRSLGLDDRAHVVAQRAEVAGRGPLRATFDAVVVRSFGAPAVAAECAAPFLRVGGTLVVAEPPGDPIPGRWNPDGLAELGLLTTFRSSDSDATQAARTTEEPITTWQCFRQTSVCPERFPRRTGVPNKRPLF
jgi:16S rRNA (guanine527-N7)-methyltransferase